jgi:ubiquinone/menaquinone biosynthesis C-methylase UbiE
LKHYEEQRLALPALNLIPNRRELHEMISDRIRQVAAVRPHTQILEAGCGNRWPFDLTGLNVSVTGIDVDSEALRIRQRVHGDLDASIVGDLRTAEFDQDSFDVIYCSFVLEHIEGVETVLDNFRRWTRPGGLIIIKVPDRDSVYGFITRMTPYWFHVFYKRYVMSKPNAGKPGFGPYPTVHERTISRKHLQKYLLKHSIDRFEEMGFGKLPAIQVGFSRIVHLVSFGSLAWDHINLLYLIQLPGSPSAADG